MEVYFLLPEHQKSLKGRLAKHIKTRVPPGKGWSKARKVAWAEMGRVKMLGMEAGL